MTSIEGHIQIELLQGSLSSLGNAPLRLYLSVTLAGLIGLMMMTFMIIRDNDHDHDHGDDDDDDDGDDDDHDDYDDNKYFHLCTQTGLASLSPIVLPAACCCAYIN